MAGEFGSHALRKEVASFDRMRLLVLQVEIDSLAQGFSKIDLSYCWKLRLQICCINGITLVVASAISYEFKNIFKALRLVWAARIENTLDLFHQLQVGKLHVATDQITLA